RKDETREPISVWILLPIHEVLRRHDLERIALDARAAVRSGAQADDLRRQSNWPIVGVAGHMMEACEDRHRLLWHTNAVPYYPIPSAILGPGSTTNSRTGASITSRRGLRGADRAFEPRNDGADRVMLGIARLVGVHRMYALVDEGQLPDDGRSQDERIK